MWWAPNTWEEMWTTPGLQLRSLSWVPRYTLPLVFECVPFPLLPLFEVLAVIFFSLNFLRVPFRLSSEERRIRLKQRPNMWRRLLTLSRLLSEVNVLLRKQTPKIIIPEPYFLSAYSATPTYVRFNPTVSFRFCGWHHRASNNSQEDLPRFSGASQQEAGQPLEEARQHSSVKTFSTLKPSKGTCIDSTFQMKWGFLQTAG